MFVMMNDVRPVVSHILASGTLLISYLLLISDLAMLGSSNVGFQSHFRRLIFLCVDNLIKIKFIRSGGIINILKIQSEVSIYKLNRFISILFIICLHTFIKVPKLATANLKSFIISSPLLKVYTGETGQVGGDAGTGANRNVAQR